MTPCFCALGLLASALSLAFLIPDKPTPVSLLARAGLGSGLTSAFAGSGAGLASGFCSSCFLREDKLIGVSFCFLALASAF